jgi:hypothetical protein
MVFALQRNMIGFGVGILAYVHAPPFRFTQPENNRAVLVDSINRQAP